MNTQKRSFDGLGVLRKKGKRSNRFPGRCSPLMLLALMFVGTMEPTWAADHHSSWPIGPEFAWVHKPSGDFATTTVGATGFSAKVRGLDFWRSAFGKISSGVSVDNNVGSGSITSIDLPLGENGWLIQGNLRYIDTHIRHHGDAFAIDRKRDLRVLSIGFGYRF